jgi:hypothetical protein
VVSRHCQSILFLILRKHSNNGDSWKNATSFVPFLVPGSTAGRVARVHARKFIFSLLEQSALGSCIVFSLSSSVLDRSHLSIGGTWGSSTFGLEFGEKEATAILVYFCPWESRHPSEGEGQSRLG